MGAHRANISKLRTRMQAQMVCCERGRRHFLPNSSVVTIFTLPNITDALLDLEYQSQERIGLADTIYEKGRKTFAILILMSAEDDIVKFRNHGALDSSLPLDEVQARRIAGDVGTSFAEQSQWQVLPQTFPDKMWDFHREYRDEEILPFIGKPESVAVGGYGEIERMRIWPSQQGFFPAGSEEVEVIRKTLKSKDITEAVQRETMCLRLLNQLQHPNIIRLLGSYTYQQEHHFLFPELKMDLDRFLGSDTRVGQFQHDYTFFSALCGLGSALLKTHELRLNHKDHGIDFTAVGYHHDLRPKNVLVSEETFVLADFGLGNMKSTEATSATPWRPTTGDYIAPECMDEEYRQLDVNRAIDVWAFGCLIADVVTYMKKGPTGVKRFRRKRLARGRAASFTDSGFYQPDKSVKSVVKEWLAKLPRDEWDERLISSLIDLSLLALTGDPAQRPTITTICERLTLLSFEAHIVAVRNVFSQLTADSVLVARGRLVSNNIRFLHERFRAWDRTFFSEQTGLLREASVLLDNLYLKSIPIMVALIHEVKKGIMRLAPDPADTRPQYESQIDQHIESLWDILPTDMRNMAEDYWHQAILSTDDKYELDNICLTLQYTAYDITTAMATMKRYRLEMASPDSIESAGPTFEIERTDVDFFETEKGYSLGRYRKQKLVVVEFAEEVFIRDEAKRVNPVQQELVTSLKVKSLRVEPKPAGLRTLRCMGAFQAHFENGRLAGCGLVYQYPEGKSEPTSLLERLRQQDRLSSMSKEYPLLGDKFRLAFAMANFIKEFHTVGWLHENFNSHNVLFFKPSPGDRSKHGDLSDELPFPYIVGFHKSRPNGSYWQSSGPDINEDLWHYQHPSYSHKGRYEPSFDYYSLGIVLLEIGLWRPLDVVFPKQKYRDIEATLQLELREMCKTKLGSKMGAVYRDIVLYCLTNGAQGRIAGSKRNVNDEEAVDMTAMLGRFTEAVVAPLGRLAAAPI